MKRIIITAIAGAIVLICTSEACAERWVATPDPFFWIDFDSLRRTHDIVFYSEAMSNTPGVDPREDGALPEGLSEPQALHCVTGQAMVQRNGQWTPNEAFRNANGEAGWARPDDPIFIMLCRQ